MGSAPLPLPTSGAYAEVAIADDADHSELLPTGSAVLGRPLLTEGDGSDLSPAWPTLIQSLLLASDCFTPILLLCLITLTLTGHLTLTLNPTPHPLSSPLPPTPLPAYLPSHGICILARTYPTHYPFLPTFLSLLTFNTHPPRVFLVHTANDTGGVDPLRAIADDANRRHHLGLASVLDVTWDSARRRYPDMDRVESFGYVHTDLAMELLADEHAAECRYVVITNGDNIYASHFVDRVELLTAQGYELIGWSFVSHHEKPALSEVGAGTWEDLTYKWVRAEFLPSEIDLGASLFKLSLWRQLHLGFTQFGRKFGFAGADGRHIMRLAAANVSRVLMRDTYLVHQ